MEDEAGGAEALSEQLFAEFAEGQSAERWAPAEWLATEATGLLSAVLRNMPLRETELRRQAVAMLRALCRMVGPSFTAHKLVPPLLASAGAGEPPRPVRAQLGAPSPSLRKAHPPDFTSLAQHSLAQHSPCTAHSP